MIEGEGGEEDCDGGEMKGLFSDEGCLFSSGTPEESEAASTGRDEGEGEGLRRAP